MLSDASLPPRLVSRSSRLVCSKMLAYRPPPAEELHHRTTAAAAAAQPTYRPTSSTGTSARSTAATAPPPLAAPTAPLARPLKQSTTTRTAPPALPPPPPAAPTPVTNDKPKSDKGKLTEQWGPPPNLIRRDNDWLQRGQLLGEVSFNYREVQTAERDGSLNSRLSLDVETGRIRSSVPLY